MTTPPRQLDPLQDAIASLHVLESRLRELIEHQLESSALEGQPDARGVLGEIEPRLFAHVEALEKRLELLGGSPSALQQALGSVVGAVASRIETLRSDERVSRILRDDFAALSLALVQSQLTEVTAESVDDPQTAEIVRAQRQALRQALKRVEEVLPAVLRAELEQEGKATAQSEA